MPKRRIVSKTSQNAAPPKCNIPVATETAFDNVKFQKELNWCVEQLRMGMLTKSPNQKQIKESTAIIKTLLSTKAPLVKKRQVMRQTFGDYRQQVEQDDIKWQKDAIKLSQAIKILKVPSEKETGNFLKASQNLNCQNHQQPMDESNLVDLFQFNFKIEDEI